MSCQICFKCGGKLHAGSLKYNVNIRISADFDGAIFEPEGDIADEIEILLTEIEQLDEKTLEREIYQDLHFIMCKRCKDLLVQEALNGGEPVAPYNRKFSGYVH